jgi:hypothetical protein
MLKYHFEECVFTQCVYSAGIRKKPPEQTFGWRLCGPACPVENEAMSGRAKRYRIQQTRVQQRPLTRKIFSSAKSVSAQAHDHTAVVSNLRCRTLSGRCQATGRPKKRGCYRRMLLPWKRDRPSPPPVGHTSTRPTVETFYYTSFLVIPRKKKDRTSEKKNVFSFFSPTTIKCRGCVPRRVRGAVGYTRGGAPALSLPRGLGRQKCRPQCGGTATGVFPRFWCCFLPLAHSQLAQRTCREK